MPTDGDDETVAVEVALPPELLDEIDRFAVHHGYENPSGVVRDALAELDEDA